MGARVTNQLLYDKLDRIDGRMDAFGERLKDVEAKVEGLDKNFDRGLKIVGPVLVALILAAFGISACRKDLPASLASAMGYQGATPVGYSVQPQALDACPVYACELVTVIPGTLPPDPTAAPTASPSPTPRPTGTGPAPSPTPVTPPVTVSPVAPNLLRCAGFNYGNGCYYDKWIGPDGWEHILNQPYWGAFYCDGCPAARIGTGNPAGLKMGRPEYKPASYLGTAGVHWVEGNSAMEWFCAFRTCNAGVYQTVDVTPGAICEVGAKVRSWSNPTGYQDSQLATQDDRDNSTWYLRVDLLGGTDPTAQTVVASRGFGYDDGHYDQYAPIVYQFQVPPVSTRVTVFFQNVRLWPFMINNSYLDAAYVRCNQ